MNELTIHLHPKDIKNNGPMYEQIYNHIKKEIMSHNFECGEKLPSTRALSRYLSVSRSTLQMAYDQLLSEGYIESVPCKGYFVCRIDGLYEPLGEHKNKIYFKAPAPEQYDYDFSPSGIELNSFPFNTWRKVTKNILTDDNKELFNIGDPQGEYEFRETICHYLRRSRGVICSPEQIIIGAGNEYLLMIIHQLLPGGSAIAMENPTYLKAYKTFCSLGRSILPIPLDKHGISIGALERSEARTAYVMPSHQYPLGIIMPIKRRTELLHWVNRALGRYVIEDDYDSEFRYKGKPIPALQGNDANEKVIYLGTFSKSIAPAIRMSYMVLPYELLTVYHEKCSFFSSTVSRIDQTVVNSFIQEGHYERHLNRMRALYKNKHDLLLNELKPFEQHFSITGENAGIHVLLTAGFPISEIKLIEQAKSCGIRIYPMSDHYIAPARDLTFPTIMIGYANMTNESIEKGIRLLKKAWQLS